MAIVGAPVVGGGGVQACPLEGSDRCQAHNDPVAGEPGARHGACRSKMASSAARHGKRRDGERRVARSERSERSRQAACLALARIRLSRSELSRPVTDRTRRGPRAQPRSKSVR